MLSAWNRLNQAVAPRWKTFNFSCISSIPPTRSYRSFVHEGTDFSLKKLHVSISRLLNTKYITSNPVKVQCICPPYSTLSISSAFKRRSLVTQASIEDEEVAHQVLDEIVSELQKTPGPIKKLCTYHINKLCRNRKLRAAARLLQLLHDKHAIHSLPAYNLLLAVACEENNTGIVTRVFKDMLLNHQLMNSTTYFNVAKAVSKSNDLTLVVSFVKEASEICEGNVTVINRIIYSFADCGHVHNAILVYNDMKSLKCKPDLFTYNTMLGIYGKSGQVEEMLEVLASMKKTNIPSDIVSYNTLLNSLRKVGRFDLCVVLVEEMREVGLQADLRTYTALIECFFRSGNVEESLRLFDEMKRGHARPSIYVYRSLVSNLKRLGKSELAGKFLEEMNECEEDLVGPKDFKRKRR